MGRDIDRKLCLSAAFLGTPTRKELASAFHAINPSTSFDLERAHKWLQARAKPRDPQLYEDWAQLLKLGKDGAWIAEIDMDTFLDTLLSTSDLDREVLVERANSFGGKLAQSSSTKNDVPSLVGNYACYSHAWSPYFRGRLIRGLLRIFAQDDGRRLSGAYTERLPNRPTTVEGPVLRLERTLHLDLRHPTEGIQLLFCLFPPSSPGSVLGGLMCGATILGPIPQPSVSRIVMMKLPGPSTHASSQDAYLPPDGSIAADLVELGLLVADMSLVDQAVHSFLSMQGAPGIDQVPVAAYHELVAMFDAQWLTSRTNPDQ